MSPATGKTQPTANFTVRIVDPATRQKVRGAPVFVSYYIDGANARPQNIHGSPATTNEEGCATFECLAHQSLIRRIVIKIECNGSALECGLLPPAPESPGRLTRVDGAVTSEHGDSASGSINLEEEPSAAQIVPPPIPPPPPPPEPSPLSVDDLMLSGDPEPEPPPEPLPISRRTAIGVPVFVTPLATNPDDKGDGVVSAPMPETHLGDTIPHELEAPSRGAPRPADVFADSVHQLERDGARPPGEAPPAVNPLAEDLLRLEEGLARVDELRLQFESSIRDEVELQRQIKVSHAALLGFPARADALLEQYRADIAEETREVKGIKHTLDLLVEGFDAKVAAAIESITQKRDEAEHSVNETLARLKTELEQARDQALAAIRAAGEAERKSMVDVSSEQKDQIRRTAPASPLNMPPVIPFHLETPLRTPKLLETRQVVLITTLITIGAGAIAVMIIDFIAHL